MMKFNTKIVSLFFGCSSLFASQEIELLKMQVEQLNKKVQDIQKQQTTPKTDLSIGGRIQVNGSYSSPEASYFASKIPANELKTSDKFSINARDTRLWVKTRTPSHYGVIRTNLEIDFFGSAATNVSVNDHNPRLRHAYIQVGDFGFGQTNSAFNSIVAIETISFAIDDTFVRQPVVRYTLHSGSFAWDISIEEPNATFFKEGSSSLSKGKSDRLADLVLRGRYFASWGEMGLAYLSRSVRYEQEKKSDTKYAYGLNLSGRIKTFGLDDLRINAHYGEGSGRYIAYNGFGAGTITKDTKIKLTTIYSAHLGYRHWWNKQFRSTLAFSYIGADTSKEALAYSSDVTKESYASQLNFFYNPLQKLLFGLELNDTTRKFKDGRRGDAQGVKFLVRYEL